MHIKKNLAIAAVVAVLAVPALGATNANASHFVPNSVTAGISGKLNHSYNGYPAGTPIYDGHGHNQVGQPKGDGNGSIGHPYDNSHPLVNIPEKYVSNPNAKINNNSKLAQNTTSYTNSTRVTNNNAKNGKLTQTGESNTGAKAGIVGFITAITSVAFASIEKFFKRA